MTPEDLRDEAAAAEAAAGQLPPGAERDWHLAKAKTLLHEADRVEHRLDLKADLLSPKPNERTPRGRD